MPGDHPFFADLKPEHRTALLAGAEPFEAAAGAFLAREGKPADSFYLLETGHVAIELQLPGRARSHLQTLGPGEAVGWSWLIPPYRWEFDARVVDAVKGQRFQATWLRDHCGADPALGVAILKKLVKVIANRLTATRLQLLDLYK